MADALVEQSPATRFFCYRCNVEFEDILQDYTCPFCASGFIEQLDSETVTNALPRNDFSDADMSNIDDMTNMDDLSLADSEEIPNLSQIVPPILNDLAFLMSGGRVRNTGPRENIMEQLVLMIGGARSGSGATTAGAPFVFIGAPEDYVFGGEGLDAVVTQLLGQLENSGPPPLSREQIAALPSEVLTESHPSTNTACSVCWDNFEIGETVSRLECSHVFHVTCITPWLQLHATCPICRRSLMPEEPAQAAAAAATPAAVAAAAAAAAAASATPTATSAAPPTTDAAPAHTTTAPSITTATTITSFPQLIIRRLPRRTGAPWAIIGSSSSSASMSSNRSDPHVPASTSSTTSTTSSSSNSTDLSSQYNMDIDYD